MTNSSDIENAVIAKLGSDAALLALVPDGVYYATAPPGSTQFVIVQVETAEDVDAFGGTAYEDKSLQVEARVLSTSGGDVYAAAQRIHELLHEQPLTVPGYSWMTVYRERGLRLDEVDDRDPSIRWFRRGGFYRVQMAI